MSETRPTPDPETTVQPVVIRPWPKIIMMLPTLVMAIICGIVTAVTRSDMPKAEEGFLFIHAVNLVFLLVLFVNLILLLYDLSLRGFLIVVLTLVVIVLLLFLLDIKKGGVWESLEKAVSLRVYANAAFYFVFALVLAVNLIVAWVITRFHYWVVERNEIIIHNGFMHEQQRHPTSTARFKLQIDDVIEYGLFGAGTLVFTFADDRSEHVLSTVLRVRSKAKQLDLLLGRVAVTEQ